MLVGAGLTPLSDRGRIAAGWRADLLLVEGDPTVDIGDSLSIRKVWRRGRELDTQGGSSD